MNSQAPGLDELIKRLESATGPDRALADDVLLACGWSMIEFGALDNPSYEWIAPDESTTYVGGDQPNPLASLDAALTLVPEGWARGVMWSDIHGIEAWVQERPGYTTCHQGYSPDGDTSTKCAALALTIAALKARNPNPPASNN